MTLYQAMVNRLVTPVIQAHEARGREEGQATERTRWQDWNRRRMEAAAKGQPFHEPPPGAEYRAARHGGIYAIRASR